jgi:hypothetical protein
MHNYKLSISAFIALFVSIISIENVSAQVLQRDTTAKVKEGIEIIRFSEDQKEDSKKKSSNVSTSIIKIAPIAFIAGYFPVFVERELNDWLSIQVGMGVTFKSAADDIFSNWSDVLEGTDTYTDYSYRATNLGFLLSVSPRLYFDSEGLEGGYLAPEMRLSSRNIKAQKPDPSNVDLSRIDNEYDKEKNNYFDLMVHYGRQTLYPKLTLDWSIGVGIRNVNSTTQIVDRNNAGIWTSTLEKSANSLFHAQIGLRVGFQL